MVRWRSPGALAVFNSPPKYLSSPYASPPKQKTVRKQRACMHGPRNRVTNKCPRMDKPRYVCMYGPRGLNDKCPRFKRDCVYGTRNSKGMCPRSRPRV